MRKKIHIKSFFAINSSQVIWYCNEVPVKESDNIQLLFRGDKCSLYIKESSLEDDGVYKVVAINSVGETSSTCRLRITGEIYTHINFSG